MITKILEDLLKAVKSNGLMNTMKHFGSKMLQRQLICLEKRQKCHGNATFQKKDFGAKTHKDLAVDAAVAADFARAVLEFGGHCRSLLARLLLLLRSHQRAKETTSYSSKACLLNANLLPHFCPSTFFLLWWTFYWINDIAYYFYCHQFIKRLSIWRIFSERSIFTSFCAFQCSSAFSKKLGKSKHVNSFFLFILLVSLFSMRIWGNLSQ